MYFNQHLMLHTNLQLNGWNNSSHRNSTRAKRLNLQGEPTINSKKIRLIVDYSLHEICQSHLI